MVDLGTYEFKDSEAEKIAPEELFMIVYADEVYESEQFLTSTRRLRLILDAKYEKEYLNNVMEKQYKHLTEVQRNELLELLKKLKIFLIEHL